MSIDKIDMFKNDVRYRDNIAHVETIPAKKASYKKLDGLNENIINYLDSKNVKLYTWNISKNVIKYYWRYKLWID